MQLRGLVIEGLGEGRKLGYPTANLDCDDKQLESGVYAARVLYKGQSYGAALAIGGDFGQDSRRKVEVHLLDLDPRTVLNGDELAVEVLEKVSEMRKVETLKELIEKIEEDIGEIRGILDIKNKKAKSKNTY